MKSDIASITNLVKEARRLLVEYTQTTDISKLEELGDTLHLILFFIEKNVAPRTIQQETITN